MKKYKNNPYLIRHNRRYIRAGESKPDHGICTFVSEYYGIFAAVKTIFYSFRSFGFVSIHDIVKYYSPISFANKDFYLQQICSFMNTGPYKVLETSDEYAKLMVRLSQLNDYPVSLEQVKQVFDDLKIEKALAAS